MFLFGTKKQPLKESFMGLEDCHSHILPGVDDGVKTMEDSLAILATYEELGVSKLWLTPHIMEDVPNETKKLQSRFKKLQDAYIVDRRKRLSEHPPIKLALSAEYMLDSLFQERLSQKDILPHGIAGNHVLVETSYFTPPYNFKQTLTSILSAGYFPILAHPERYVYMDKKMYKELKEMKVRFQMNLSSLAGMYGRNAQKKSIYLLDSSFYNYVGTDLHRRSQLDAMIESRVYPFKKKVLI